MLKIALGIFIVFLIFVPLTHVSAQSVAEAQSVLKYVGQNIFGEGEEDVVTIVGRIIQAVLGLVGVVFTILIIYGGILYMTAAGNQDQVGKARTLIRDSIIGLTIIITAFAITQYVLVKLFLAVEA